MSTGQATATEGRTGLYRLYDALGNLLYVGIGFMPSARWRAHRDQPWWPLVARHEVTWYDGREDAEEAEAQAICDEEPLFNIKTDRQRYRRPKGEPGPALRAVSEAAEEYRMASNAKQAAAAELAEAMRAAHHDGCSQAWILSAARRVWSREYLRIVLGLAKRGVGE